LQIGEFRKTVNQIVPLLVDNDPGAKDCLKENRTTFRSGFAPENYPAFEAAINKGEFNAALVLLKHAAKRHGLSI
jgi:hypothetical protein